MKRSPASLHELVEQLTRERNRLRVENAVMRTALGVLADRDSWRGNPLSLHSVLFGHFTAYEVALIALADCDVSQ